MNYVSQISVSLSFPREVAMDSPNEDKKNNKNLYYTNKQVIHNNKEKTN